MRRITGSTEGRNHKTEWENRESDKEENNHLVLLSRIQYLDIPASLLSETLQTYSTYQNTDSRCAINTQHHKVKQVEHMFAITLQFLM